MSAIFWSWSNFVIFVGFSTCITSNNVGKSDRYAIKVNKMYKENIIQLLQENGFTLLFEITSETYIIEYNGDDRGSSVIRNSSGLSPNQIVSWEPVRVYDNTLQPASDYTPNPPSNQSIVICENYYGMRVEEAWLLGYTGKGVKIAVNDVGINVDLLDLKNNIETSLSFNFFKQTINVTPEDFADMSTEAVERTDHGNRIASVVAAEKDNNICNAGIAFNAKLVALKMFEVDPQSGQRTTADIVGRSFVHKLIDNDIDIFVNAWRPTAKFDPLDLSSLEALKLGATTGRHTLGTIYLVPAGTPGNRLSNNIYTITVGGMGRFGSIPSDANVDASVITSGLSVGNNITAIKMVTASKNNKCITSFNGTSLATAQIAGIIALGMEANPHLSQRDILHLLVKASERTGLVEQTEFRQNGAGLYVHKVFGFGLLNARLFVELARHGISTPTSITTELSHNKRTLRESFAKLSFCFQCSDINAESCMTYIEYVEVSLNLTTDAGSLRITVISPSNTESLLMDDNIKQSGLTYTVESKFVSAHFWDELPFGIWIIKIDYLQNYKTIVKDANITFQGTHSFDSRHFKQINRCEENSILEESKTSTEQQPMVHNEPIIPFYMWIILCIFIIILVIIILLHWKSILQLQTKKHVCQRKRERSTESSLLNSRSNARDVETQV